MRVQIACRPTYVQNAWNVASGWWACPNLWYEHCVTPPGHPLHPRDGGCLHRSGRDSVHLGSGTRIGHLHCIFIHLIKSGLCISVIIELGTYSKMYNTYVRISFVCVCVRVRAYPQDGGPGNPDALHREQKHYPAGPGVPDPPVGLVRLRLPALVSTLHSPLCSNRSQRVSATHTRAANTSI